MQSLYEIFQSFTVARTPGWSKILNGSKKFKLRRMLTFSVQIGDFLYVSMETRLQSLPIQMRATIQYLANLWMDFKMLFTTNIFSYLVKVLLLTCPLISQFIAHFWSICPFLCTASFTIPIIIQVRAAAKHTLPLLPLLPSFSSFPSVSEQNGGPKKALKPLIRGTEN